MINIKAQEFWEKENYIESIEIGKNYLEKNIRHADEFTELYLNLAYALYSASKIHLYNEFKILFRRYISLISDRDNEPPIGYHNHVCLLQQNVIASIFQLYEGMCEEYDVESAYQMLVEWSESLLDKENFVEFNSRLGSLVHQILIERKDIYYCIKLKLPFSIPLPDGIYEVNCIKNLQEFSVNTFKSDDLSSRIGDRYFSDIELKFKGYTNTDNYWFGPNISDQEFPKNAQLALSAVNHMILNAKLSDENLRLFLATYNDIGTISTRQFDGNGELYHYSIGLGLGGNSLVDVLTAQTIGESKLDNLIQRLKKVKHPLHDELFANALIENSNLNLVGAFYLLNSATEAMIDYFLEIIAINHNQAEVYEEYFAGKSYCLECEIYKTHPTLEPPRKPMPPSTFQKLKLLNLLNVATRHEVESLQSSVSKIRYDNLRNNLTHGRRFKIPSKILVDAIKEFKILRSFFESKL